MHLCTCKCTPPGLQMYTFLMSLLCTQAANGNIDEQHNRVVSEPKPHNGRVTLLSMSRWVPGLPSCHPFLLFQALKCTGQCTRGCPKKLSD